MAQKKGLGSKGLGIEALINTQMADLKDINKLQNEYAKESVVEIDINKVEPNKKQPRKNFDPDSLEELAESIKTFGVIQPIIVKKTEDYYEIIAGERRWRASKIAGLKKIPAIVKDFDTAEAFQVSLIENIQRENLNPIEEAMSYKRLMEDFSMSQEEISQKVGKSRAAVANSVRLLNLDKRVMEMVYKGTISVGHAKVLLAIQDNDMQAELAEKVEYEELSVRELENLVKKLGKEKPVKEYNKFSDIEYDKIADSLKNIFGTKVNIARGKRKGKIEIEYYSAEDLDRLICLINKISE